MGCRHADFTNNHATPQPEAGLRPKDFQALSVGILFAAALLAFAAWLGVARPRLLTTEG
jgi:hypothetical protein